MMSPTTLAVILLASTVSASWFSADSPEFRHRVFTYANSFYTDSSRKVTGDIGKALVQYGRTFTTCLKETERTRERSDLVSVIESHVMNNDMKDLITNFYKYFIEPEGGDKVLFLNMMSPYIKDTQLPFTKENDYYVLDSSSPKIMIPEQPNFDLSPSECSKIDFFIDRTSYRLQNYQYELEFYTLSIFALENFPETEKELKNPHKQLLSYRRYLRDHMRNYGNRKLEQIFGDFMRLRDSKQEMIKKDMEECTEPERKAELEDLLKFHQQTSKMMLRGWIRVNRLSDTDGKLWIVDHNLKTRRSYDITDDGS